MLGLVELHGPQECTAWKSDIGMVLLLGYLELEPEEHERTLEHSGTLNPSSGMFS